MKIKNEYVEIKTGKKRYIKQNMILDIYLKRLFDMQYKTNHDTTMINACFLNFTEPIDVQYDSILTENDFDVIMTNISDNDKYFKKISILNKNTIKLKYVFDDTSSFYKDHSYGTKSVLYDYINIPLYGIGFGYLDPNDNGIVFAYLDTSNMNIIINAEESLSVSRLDILQSDGMIKGYDFPLHLVNDSAFYEMRYEGLRNKWVKKAILTNIYYGTYYGNVEGLPITPTSIELEDNSVTYHVSRIKQEGRILGQDLTLPFTLLPDNSKTIVLQYDIYEQLTDDYSSIIATDEKYYMVYNNEDEGNLKIKLSIERGD